MIVMGIHYGHDSSACVVVDGVIRAAVAEERFSRVKNDSSFPIQAIRWCIKEANVEEGDIDVIAFAGQDLRLDSFAFIEFPDSVYHGVSALKRKIKQVIKNSLFSNAALLKGDLPRYMAKIKLRSDCRVVNVEHHLAHASSAYFTAGLGDEKTLIVTMDGLGDMTSSALWIGENNKIRPLRSYGSSGSVGWFYGNATEALGWRHGSDEWKVMGLAPYGKSSEDALRGYCPAFTDGRLVSPHHYGSFGYWMDHGAKHFHGQDAEPLSAIAKKMKNEDFAATVQNVVEQQMMSFIVPAMQAQDTRTLCCAGGCFLNVKFNQRLWYSGAVDDQWIYPDPGDAGLSVGAALYANYCDNPGNYNKRLDNVYWGPSFSDEYIERILQERGLIYERPDNLSDRVSDLLMKNYAVGWFQGRMEAGPRALGNRSILMSPLEAENKDRINAKVKYREAFRPFCPSILAEYRDTYLQSARDERFMLTSFDVVNEKRHSIPAVVHVDGTVRPQLVYRKTNPRYYDLIKSFGEKSGEYVILNTSFNIKGEPIVCSPREAIKCFFDTGLDVLVLNAFVVFKPTINGTL